MSTAMTWDDVAAKEGRIYCQTEDTWCAMVDMANGECTRKTCVNEEGKRHDENQQEK